MRRMPLPRSLSLSLSLSWLLPPLFSLLIALGSCDDALPGARPTKDGSTAAGGATGAGQGGRSGTADEVATIMAKYPTWQPLSDEPVNISDAIFMLCRSRTAAEMRFLQSPHHRLALRDWANPTALDGLATMGAGGYPVGSVIVKEKFAAATAADPLVLTALGMMIKRAPGFDSASGDWEFAFWNAADGITRGRAKLPACTTCHVGAAATDFVFKDSSWRMPSAAN